jgi:hypothetical protein
MGGATGRVAGVGNGALRRAIGRYYEQRPDPELLRAEVCAATFVVPVRHGREVYTVDHGGVCWILAFTSREAFARFAMSRVELQPPCWFVTVGGARLLDSFTRAITRGMGMAGAGGGVGSVGVAVDVGGEQPVLLPAPAGTPCAGLDAMGLDVAGVGGG